MSCFTEQFMEQIDDEFDNPNVEPYEDDERAIALLRQCVKVYRSVILGKMLTARREALKDVSELYGVPVALVNHAVENGPCNAHNRFRAPPVKPLRRPEDGFLPEPPLGPPGVACETSSTSTKDSIKVQTIPAEW